MVIDLFVGERRVRGSAQLGAIRGRAAAKTRVSATTVVMGLGWLPLDEADVLLCPRRHRDRMLLGLFGTRLQCVGEYAVELYQ